MIFFSHDIVMFENKWEHRKNGCRCVVEHWDRGVKYQNKKTESRVTLAVLRVKDKNTVVHKWPYYLGAWRGRRGADARNLSCLHKMRLLSHFKSDVLPPFHSPFFSFLLHSFRCHTHIPNCYLESNYLQCHLLGVLWQTAECNIWNAMASVMAIYEYWITLDYYNSTLPTSRCFLCSSQFISMHLFLQCFTYFFSPICTSLPSCDSEWHYIKAKMRLVGFFWLCCYVRFSASLSEPTHFSVALRMQLYVLANAIV